MAATELRLHHRRRRLGRLHARQPADRGQRRARALLEAGGWDRDPLIHIPLAWGKHLRSSACTTGCISTEPEPALDGRGIECARGKVIGGSSSINAMAYVRGNRGDYDRWADSGLTQWSYAHALPYFKRQESWEGGADRYRGGDGPLTTASPQYEDPLVRGLPRGRRRRPAIPSTEDYNGAQQEGFGRSQSTIRNGRRCSAAVGLSAPGAAAQESRGRDRRAGDAASSSKASRAVGIEYQQGRRDRDVARRARSDPCRRRHQLAAAPDAVGDRRSRRNCAAHGIAVRSALPGVGRNLQDHHLRRRRISRAASPGRFTARMRIDRIARALARAYFLGTGPVADVPGGVMALLKSARAGAMPDIQILFRMAPVVPRPYLPPFKPPSTDGFGLRAVLLRPRAAARSSLPRPIRARRCASSSNFLAHRQPTSS